MTTDSYDNNLFKYVAAALGGCTVDDDRGARKLVIQINLCRKTHSKIRNLRIIALAITDGGVTKSARVPQKFETKVRKKRRYKREITS